MRNSGYVIRHVEIIYLNVAQLFKFELCSERATIPVYKSARVHKLCFDGTSPERAKSRLSSAPDTATDFIHAARTLHACGELSAATRKLGAHTDTCCIHVRRHSFLSRFLPYSSHSCQPHDLGFVYFAYSVRAVVVHIFRHRVCTNAPYDCNTYI